ncbi:MAG: CPBP family intramembrane metalloprotease [Acidobacteriia bacterium]|nr:CPBP family intramembrane metalloprotease [Terriglobia bacterium]
MASSAIFASLHAFNDNASILSAVGIFVIGVFLAAAVLVTGRLSTAIGVHMAWNFVQGAVFGFPVSGDKEGASLIGIRQGGPSFLTGGAFGPEAGLAGIVASLAGIGALVAWRRWRRQARARAEDVR